MQWNMHKTKGSDGVCNPDRIANTIVAQNVDVVSLNEVNFFSGDCAWTFDMSERLQSLVQQKTGRTWYRQSVNAGGVGNVLLSRYPPVSSSSTSAQQRPRRGADGDCRERPHRERVLDPRRIRQCRPGARPRSARRSSG